MYHQSVATVGDLTFTETNVYDKISIINLPLNSNRIIKTGFISVLCTDIAEGMYSSMVAYFTIKATFRAIYLKNGKGGATSI